MRAKFHPRPIALLRGALAGLALAIGLVACDSGGMEKLPALGAKLDATSVSGVSSGAYMAGQFHVAFSGSLVGAAIVAGGPYDCAENSIAFALQRCMETNLGTPDPARLVARARDREARREIDPLAGLADDRIYVFSGTRDATVTPPVVATVDDFYRLAGVPDGAIEVVDVVPAGHDFVTETEGNRCAVTGPSY